MKQEYSKEELELIADAWLMQNACNLSGIAHSFSKAMTILSRIAFENSYGTDWKNKHIVAKLYVDKMLSLAGQVDLLELYDLDLS